MSEKHIVRGVNSGVFFGEILTIEGTRCEMKNVRKIHRWEGATAVEGLAMYGSIKPENCRLTMVVPSVQIFDICQKIQCTDEAVKVLEGVKVWTLN